MIIDAHTHIHLPGHEGHAVPELLRAMDEARIDMAAVFAGCINGLPTEQVLKETEAHQDRLFVVGSVSPIMPGYQEPPAKVDEWLASGRVRALKFYTGYEHFYPHDERLTPYMELLIKHGRPAIFHLGDLYDKIPGALLEYSQPLPIDRLAVRHPDLTIVMAHMANPWIVTAAEVCYKNRNVYADCSGYVYGRFGAAQLRRFTAAWKAFDDVTEDGAADKILYGSDWPICDMDSYVDTVGSCCGKDEERRAKVFSENAKKVYGL